MHRGHPRVLGQFSGGSLDGIVVVDPMKHWPIDPSKYTTRQLEIHTDPLGAGSKWLVGVSPEERLRLVREVLEYNNACFGQRGRFLGPRQSDPIGVSHGHRVHTVEVRLDGRYAHGYPSPP